MSVQRRWFSLASHRSARMQRIVLAIVPVLFLALPVSCRADLEGRVVGISDGDTVTVLAAENIQYKVRLLGIDAPEKAQPFGARAKEALSGLVFGQSVTVEGNKRDRYGRTVGRLWVAPPDADCRGSPACPRSLDANLAQVSAGMAWWYRQYAREQALADQARYAVAEGSARVHERGLWGDPDPVPPWDWRRAKREGRSAAR